MQSDCFRMIVDARGECLDLLHPTCLLLCKKKTLKLKQSRNGVARPFVFMDMGAFVPEWATVVVCCIFK
jgi:hypothetical protein